MNILEKIILLFKKPRIVVLAENDRERIEGIAATIAGSRFRIKREVLFAADLEKTKLSSRECLVYNFDKEGLRKIREKAPETKLLTFGFQEGADFQASDLRQGEEDKSSSSPVTAARENGGTNFKINYQGKIVPVWLEGSPTREEIYSVLAASAIGVLLGLNLVEISQALKKS